MKGRAKKTTTLKPKPSEANYKIQYRNFTKNHTETKAAHERKLKPKNAKIPLSLKLACDNLHYRRNQKYFRTLSSVAQNFRLRKTQITTFQNFSFCFLQTHRSVWFLFLAPRNAELSGSF